MIIVTPFLPGGPSSDGEAFRHECEVRHLARMRDIERRRFIDGVAQKRGQPAADRLSLDVMAHWRLARELAEMETNAQRSARLREIALERGQAFAQGLRESAWALMQEQATA